VFGQIISTLSRDKQREDVTQDELLDLRKSRIIILC